MFFENILEVLESFSKSIDYATKLFARGAELIVMIITGIIPIVDFIFVGYIAKIIREGSSSQEPPKYDHLGDLFVDGLKIFIVGLVWAIPAALLGAVVVAIFIPFAVLTNMTSIPAWQWLTLGWTIGVAFILAFVIGIIVMIFAMIGILLVARTGQISKAFTFNDIRSVVNDVGFGKHLLWIVVAFLIGIVIGILDTIPVFGWLIMIIILPLEGTFFARSATLFYDAALNRALAVLPPPPPD